MSEPTTDSLLTVNQRARAEALREARGVLVERTGPFSVAAPEVVDMHSLAVFILDGGDPWTLPLEPQSEPFAGLRYDHDEGRTVPTDDEVVDAHIEDEPFEPSTVYTASVTNPGGITFTASVVVPMSAAYPDQLELTETVQMASASMASGFKRAENIRAALSGF